MGSKLLEDCLKLEAYFRYNAAHEIYKLDGQVPNTVMSGKTSDISQFCKQEWFKCIIFPDKLLFYQMMY